MAIPGTELSERIAHALELLKAAKEHLASETMAVQEQCPHTFILGDKSHTHTRICLCCRFEEQNSNNYSWKVLKASEDRMILAKDQAGNKEPYQLRLPK